MSGWCKISFLQVTLITPSSIEAEMCVGFTYDGLNERLVKKCFKYVLAIKAYGGIQFLQKTVFIGIYRVRNMIT